MLPAAPAAGSSGIEGAVAPRVIRVAVVMVSFYTGPALRRRSIDDAVLAQRYRARTYRSGQRQSGRGDGGAESPVSPASGIGVLTGHGNVGFAAACNMGAKEASGEYLLLLNPDCILQRNALIDLIRLTEGAARPWVAGCRHRQSGPGRPARLPP